MRGGKGRARIGARKEGLTRVGGGREAQPSIRTLSLGSVTNCLRCLQTLSLCPALGMRGHPEGFFTLQHLNITSGPEGKSKISAVLLDSSQSMTITNADKAAQSQTAQGIPRAGLSLRSQSAVPSLLLFCTVISNLTYPDSPGEQRLLGAQFSCRGSQGRQEWGNSTFRDSRPLLKLTPEPCSLPFKL